MRGSVSLGRLREVKKKMIALDKVDREREFKGKREMT